PEVKPLYALADRQAPFHPALSPEPSMFWSCTVLLAITVAQPPDLPPFVKTYSRVGTYYYTDPDPKIGPKMLKELLKKENLEHAFCVKNEHGLTLTGAQLGDIASGKREVVREYETAFAEAAPAGRKVIVRALTNCGDKETVKQVDAWVADK